VSGANLVSVVVCTLGRSRQLARCLEALRPTGAEIVLVDQSPHDDVSALAAEVTYLRVPDEGVSRARNLGAAAAANDVLAFTDDDCVPAGDWIDVLARAYGEAGVDGVTGRVLPLPDGQGRVPVSSRTSTVRRAFQGPEDFPWEIGTGGNMSLRRSAFRQIGGFDESLGPGTSGRAAEDVDLLYRAVAAGCTVVYEPDAVVYHERKTRRDRLAGRFDYGYGMGSFVQTHTRRGDQHARPLRLRYASVLARVALARARRGDAWPLVEGALTLAGMAAASSRLARR
jgi:GT2 family glycosyltransferase